MPVQKVLLHGKNLKSVIIPVDLSISQQQQQHHYLLVLFLRDDERLEVFSFTCAEQTKTLFSNFGCERLC